ncbi:MAG: DUF4198 domain-containing protein [Mucilaginibacter sp.]
MKYVYPLISFLLLSVVYTASAQDDILLPENFYVHKGEKINIHLVTVNQFSKKDELSFDPAKIQKFTLGWGKKAGDLMPALKATDTATAMQFDKDGLNTLTMTMKPVLDDIERDDFIKILEDEGLTDFAENAKNGSKDSFRERYTRYLKSLIKVQDKTAANDFEKSQGQDFEITLKDNPYKGSYGDDIIASVTFRDKPAVNATVLFYIKAADGNVFVQKLNADKQGFIYFKLTREGIYLLRSAHMEVSKDKSADYEAWLATYTFAFESTNEMPNTYKQFGFGNKH